MEPSIRYDMRMIRSSWGASELSDGLIWDFDRSTGSLQGCSCIIRDSSYARCVLPGISSTVAHRRFLKVPPGRHLDDAPPASRPPDVQRAAELPWIVTLGA